MGHRPMYCSDDDQDDCTKFDSYVRPGRPVGRGRGLSLTLSRTLPVSSRFGPARF